MRAFSTVLVTTLVMVGSLACDSEEHEARIAELEAELALAKQAAGDREADTATIAKQATELAEANASVEELEAQVESQQQQLTELEAAKGSLEGELENKKAALDAVKTLQDALSKTLVEEVETGEVSVSQRNGLLVVDVSDKVLFAVGEAELSERGQKVLTRLAESLQELPKDTVFQVGGHTDNQPIKSEEVKAKFPTNWELSAARATNVVRFLEETAGISGKRLVAAGFSEFRPIASNKKEKTRAKNRRIEIALLP